VLFFIVGDDNNEKAELSCVTIEAAVLPGVLQEAVVCVQGRSEHKHPGVEAVGPAGVRSCRQLVSVEQLVHVTQDLRGDPAHQVSVGHAMIYCDTQP